MKMEIENRHRTLSRLRAGFGAVALAGLVSCAGGVDDQDLKDPPDENAADPDEPIDAYKVAPYKSDSILVRFKRDASFSAQSALHDTIGARVAHVYTFLPNLQAIELPATLSVEEALAQYQKDPNVLYAEPNFIYQHTATTPNDARFGELFGLHNTGQSGGVADADIDAVEAWDLTQGSDQVVVALLDSGIDYNHPDLNANSFVNLSEFGGTAGVDDDGNGFIDDVRGINTISGTGDPFPNDADAHGTHVSGTIAAAGNNSIGVVGVNWRAKIIACKAFGPAGATLVDIIECMDYFLEMKTRAVNPVNIIASNNSWGGGGFSQALLDSILAHNSAGMLFVAAAGNSNQNTDVTPHFPSTYDAPNIIAVLASNRSDQKASFSSFGPRTVDVGAPGQDILSTTPGNTFSVFSGTSMATPHVVGLVALLKAHNPARTPAQIKNLILTGGDVTPATDTEVLTGRRINAFGSLTCVDRILNNRFAPSGNNLVVGTGSPIPLGVLSINCDQPNPAAMTVRVVQTGQSIPLLDANGSGSFVGQFTPSNIGAFTLEFRQGTTVIDTVNISAIGSYDPPRLQPAECRTITGTNIPLGDDQSISVASPFPIQFAGAAPGLNSVFVGSNGVLSFSSAITSFSNVTLPSTISNTVVAPLWDDLNPGPSGGGDVFHQTTGTAPNRELVIEYRGVSHFSNVPAATFQVVFFENSPNILFNYCDITFEGNPIFSGGASATIGVQVAPGVAQLFSFNTASVTDGQAVLFSMGAPIAVAGPDQVVLPGASVTLNGSASEDLDGTIASYAWTQVGGQPVDLIGSNTPIASFTAPANSGTLTFQLAVTDDEGQTSTDRVDVIINFPPLAEAGASIRVATQLVGTLDCSASTDDDGIVVGFQWRQLGGDPVVINNDGSSVATFVAPARGPQFLVFQCTVTDDLGFTDSDVVVADVFFNAFPLANAGNDRIVRPGSTARLDASKSGDSDGTITTYSWQSTMCMTFAGPCQVTLDDASSPSPSFVVPDASGFAHFVLVVTDNIGATATDTVTIHFARQPPQVVATVEPECVSPSDLVTLSAACVDPDGTVTSLTWRQTGGAPVTLNGAATATATFTAPSTAQALAFEAVCTDDDGQSESAPVTVNIAAAPVAVAVCAPAGVFEGQTVSCNAFGSQNAVDFTWSSPTDPGVIIPPGITTSFVAPDVQGFRIIDVQLTASNECGATSNDTVQIVVVGLN
jgi:subtilisin family serine protease